MPDNKSKAAAPSLGRASGPLLLSDVCKFTALAALLAIFVDAVVGHAMLWGNDPYWTYWITDTLLMATVFGLGTAWLGIGLARGAIITAVHMVLLTAYYWSLSPIGLPSQPEWLDLEHTWITGLPVHFAVYYLGYVIALWLWRRRPTDEPEPGSSTARQAALAVGVAVAVVVVAGLAQALVSGEFPGVTWFVMRIAVASAFTMAWWSIAGRDRAAAVAGGIMLGFLLVAYGHFLGPVGLPNTEFRVLAENPPPAEVHWLSYRQEFLVILPMTILLGLFGYLLAAHREKVPVRWRSKGIVAGAVSVVALAILGVVVAPYTGPDAKSAVITADGSARIGGAPVDGGDLSDASAALRMRVEDRNAHRTPLPPHDIVDLEASVSSPDGTTYIVRATEPMVTEPRGLFTTWYGVGFDVWHHGRSGIGYAGLSSIKAATWMGAFPIPSPDAAGRFPTPSRCAPLYASTQNEEQSTNTMHPSFRHALRRATGNQPLQLPARGFLLRGAVRPGRSLRYRSAGHRRQKFPGRDRASP